MYLYQQVYSSGMFCIAYAKNSLCTSLLEIKKKQAQRLWLFARELLLSPFPQQIELPGIELHTVYAVL